MRNVFALLLFGTLPLLPAAHAALPEEPDFLCQVTPSQKIELASQVPGVLKQVLVNRGDKVTAGEPVAQLRDELERVEVELARAKASDTASLRAQRAKFAFATRKLDRNVDLARSNVVSANDLDQMRTERDVAAQDVDAAIEAQKEAQIELRKAEVELEMRAIRSPVNGIVTDRRAEPGELVRDQPVVVIQQVDPLYVEITLPVGLMGQVKAGTPATISIEAPDVKPIHAAVTTADQVIDPASNTYSVRIVLPNPDGTIPAGSKCHARFAVPQTAGNG